MNTLVNIYDFWDYVNDFTSKIRNHNKILGSMKKTEFVDIDIFVKDFLEQNSKNIKNPNHRINQFYINQRNRIIT